MYNTKVYGHVDKAEDMGNYLRLTLVVPVLHFQQSMQDKEFHHFGPRTEVTVTIGEEETI